MIVIYLKLEFFFKKKCNFGITTEHNVHEKCNNRQQKYEENRTNLKQNL